MRAKEKRGEQDLERVDSMWSLRTKRSVRLQQWGSWICYEDQNVGSMFWYDQRTKTNSWKKPKEVEDMQKKAMDDATSRWDTLTKTASMRIKKIGNWIQYTGGMGKTFYFNERTYEFQWERPEECDAGEEAGDGGGSGGASTPSRGGAKGAKQQAKGGGGGGGSRDAKEKTNKDKTEKAIARAQRERMRLLQEWTTYRDPKTGMTFWHNNLTQESLWEPPPRAGRA